MGTSGVISVYLYVSLKLRKYYSIFRPMCKVSGGMLFSEPALKC